MFSLAKRLTQNHWPIFLLSNISSVVNMLLPIVLVRLYAPIEMGLYKTFFLYLSLIPFIVMAGGPLNSVYYWMGKTHERDDYIKATWLLTFILSSLILIPGAFIIMLFKEHLALSTPILFILLISGFLVCPSGHYNEVCIARGKTFLGAGLSVCFEVVKTIGFIFIAWKYRDINYLFYYFFCIMCLSFILMTYLGWRSNAVSLKWDQGKIREILKYSMPVSLSSCLLFITEKADLLIISAVVSADLFAFYSLGCLIIPPLYLLENSVQKNLIPKLSIAMSKLEFDQMAFAYRKAISDIAYLVIPAVAGLIVFATPIINLLYTTQYEKSAIFLQIFALGYLLLLIPHDSILRATAKTDAVLKIYSYITPVSFLIIFLSVKFLDLRWALIIGIITKLIPKIYCLNISAGIIHKKAAELIPAKKLLHYAEMCIFLSAICYAAKKFFSNELQWFLVCAPLFAICYLTFFISRSDSKH
ncbi:oligosaccharide flippase family protein [Bacteriovorax sp. PP10]|uniref:Oligosaccharide flippase family protein n=1 Tax=Bacteriovorax antarcticus TaxID=3088717 RepID=A0ABU5VSY9_9BACT|nr:oligosaccharide flippase family protein [Bacteriovorax sp. PP10]MEA9356170.1 oligosaccharide flippase family protein [Bacteriovorax sp. PP10]